MKSLVIFFVFLFLATFVSAYAIETGPSEIVLTDVWLEPEHPQAGDKVSIVGKVYNGGTYSTDFYAKVVTVGVTIDGELRKIMELGNVVPGESNNVKISTGPLWEAEWGKHNVTVIIDYHNTLQDQYDNPTNNKISKIFNIEPSRPSKILLDIFPSYIIPEKSNYIKINGTLLELDTGTPLSKKNIILIIGDDREALITDENGKFSISKAMTFSGEKFLVTASYDGSFPNLPVNKTGYVFHLPPSKESAAVVLQMSDPSGKYNFQNLPSQIAVFQDSYDKVYKKINTTNDLLLDNDTAWIGLPGNHSYLEEIYVDGRFFFSTDWKQIPVATALQETLDVPETAQIRFHVIDANGNPIEGVSVKNWIYSAKTDEAGFTQWIDTLPTRTKNEPYVAVASTIDGNTFNSESFFAATDERKIIEINAPYSQIAIPSWIKNNAKWWSEGSIGDSDFVKGIQYLIQIGVIKV